MNLPLDPPFSEARELTWAERNQQWLAQRFALWGERIEHKLQHDADDRVVSAPPPMTQDFEPAAMHLATLFGLSAFETELLVLAAGVEIDTAVRDGVARAQGAQPGQPVRLSFSLALALLPQPHWDALSPSGPLRHWLLVGLDSEAGFAEARLRVDERILHHLTGLAALDERLSGIARFEEITADAVPTSAPRIARAVSESRHPLTMLVYSPQDAARKRASRALARAVFQHLGLRTLWVDMAALVSAAGTDARELAETARRIDREAALAAAGIALVVDAEGDHGASAARLIATLRSAVIVLGGLAAHELADIPERKLFRFNVPVPQATLSEGLPTAIANAARRALQQFHVEPALLDQALASAAGLEEPAAVESTLWDALRECARGGLDALAQRIESRVRLEDLVLPPLVSTQLRQIASQVRHRQRVYEEWGFGERDNRGRGIAALFAGESGTGKTMAAEAIANEVGLDLYRIDLASVVSKYIGETEKNLARLFHAAERSGAVLLFDEADAIFGKRSDVKDSHDRYANIEVAYLLQRIDAYRGLAILTSNLKSALDRAFLRRIRFVVQFPFPDEAARQELWRRQFPERAPRGEIDFGALARLQLSGGHIRNVVLNAAFVAAEQIEPIGHAALTSAARAEFAKLERSFNPSAGAGA